MRPWFYWVLGLALLMLIAAMGCAVMRYLISLG